MQGRLTLRPVVYCQFVLGKGRELPNISATAAKHIEPRSCLERSPIPTIQKVPFCVPPTLNSSPWHRLKRFCPAFLASTCRCLRAIQPLSYKVSQPTSGCVQERVLS